MKKLKQIAIIFGHALIVALHGRGDSKLFYIPLQTTEKMDANGISRR